jgi:6-phosphogluconate dehydrogenase
MKLGFLGLGKMGTRMVEKLLRDGHDVVAWNRSANAVDNFKLQLKDIALKGEFTVAAEIKGLIEHLEHQRIIWLMLPAGDATETVLQEIIKYLEPGDIVVDGANAFYKDTERRFKELKEKHIRFLGIGVSGGIKAAENGYPLMAGGDYGAYMTIGPLLETLAKPNGGFEYYGEGGAGHFVKMVHNGIEYGMMQAIGEGFGVLEKAPYTFDLLKVAQLWQKNTIISSFLIDRATDALKKNALLDDIEGVIDATGEAEWTVTQAKEEGVPAENIDQSLDFRRRSKTDKNVSESFAARMVAALRREFGGHSVKEKRIEQ